LILVVLWVCLFLTPAQAQDTHYWHNQYGPKSMLLGGAVIGSVHDMSATYYNPGALGYIKKPELLLSANVFRASTLTMRNGAGEGLDLETSKVDPLPNMLAGAFRWKWLGENKLAYSFITRYRFDAELRGGRVTRSDILPWSPGEEDFAGGLKTNMKINEVWAGLTFARAATGKIGWGITQYLSVRGLGSDQELFAQARTDSGQMALVYEIDNYSGDFYSLLWKAGLGFNFHPITAGITITTPNLQLSGSGRAAVNSTYIGIDVDDDGTRDDVFEANIQEDVTANYQSPLSIGAGAAYHGDKFAIHASAEWFDAVESYDVLELNGFVSQWTGETVDLSLQHRVKSVVNYAAGLEIKRERFDGFVSFSTDFSSYDPESDVAVTPFDIYHATGGTNIKMSRSSIMLGLSLAWGSDQINQPIDLNPDPDSVVDPDDLVDLVYRSYTFIIGFSVDL